MLGWADAEVAPLLSSHVAGVQPAFEAGRSSVRDRLEVHRVVSETAVNEMLECIGVGGRSWRILREHSMLPHRRHLL